MFALAAPRRSIVRMRLIAGFWVLVLAASAAPVVDFNDLIDRGRVALQAFEVVTAKTALDGACQEGRQALAPQQAALCAHYYGVLAESLGRDGEAAGQYRVALSRWQQAGAAYAPLSVSTMANLGNVYRRRRSFDEAVKVLTQALELAKPLMASHPALQATVLERMGTLYGELDQPDRARAALGEAIAALRSLPESRTELASALSSLGMLELHCGHYRAGEADLREAVTVAESVPGEQNPETAIYSTNLALALMLQGQHVRAQTLLRRARFVIEARLGPDSIHLINTLGELSSVERELGHFGLAEDCAEKALRILQSQLAASGDEGNSLEMVLLEANLGNLYVREHKLVDAERVLPAAVEAERRLFPGDRALADGLRNLASLRSQQGSWKEAEALYREAIEVYERRIGPDHPDLAPVLRDYAAVLKRQRAPKAQVKNIEARARSIAAA
jgi:tetratricopeptide (TPR) repeat protein